MKEELNEDSCIKKDPFIKLGTGQPPELNYNIPQSACFRAYGHHFVKGINQESFLQQTQQKPPNNYFDAVANTDEPVLRQRLAEAIQLQRTDEPLIASSALLRRHINLGESNLKAVSLAETPSVGPALQAEGATPAQAFVFEKTNAINEVQLTRLAKEGVRPMIMEKMGGFETQVKYVKEPLTPMPYFAIVEEYPTCSYLGDYGAGKTVKTFSLLPGEKTTITVHTYKDSAATKAYSENVLDSFSESSTNELEKQIEEETGHSGNTTTNSATTQRSSSSWNVGGNLGVSLFGIINFGVNGGYQSGSSLSATISSSAVRASNVRTLNKALNKHISNANSNRQINVNTTTTQSFSEGEDTSIVRELVNINKSRVLNFVFRQLLQQYTTVTYLSNVKVAFCNGYEESLRLVDLEELNVLLEDTLVPSAIVEAGKKILKNYCSISNYKDEVIPFIEKVTLDVGACVGMQETETFWRIKKDIQDTYTPLEGGATITVGGPILHAETHTIRTDSVVVDALLGQGEALDCYNMKLQDADAIKSQLSNIEILQQMEAINSITDPQQRADAYKKVFGNCCDNPQVIIGGCGCADNTTNP